MASSKGEQPPESSNDSSDESFKSAESAFEQPSASNDNNDGNDSKRGNSQQPEPATAASPLLINAPHVQTSNTRVAEWAASGAPQNVPLIDGLPADAYTPIPGYDQEMPPPPRRPSATRANLKGRKVASGGKQGVASPIQKAAQANRIRPGLPNTPKCPRCAMAKSKRPCTGQIPICDQCYTRGYDEEMCTNTVHIRDLKGRRKGNGDGDDGRKGGDEGGIEDIPTVKGGRGVKA